MYDLDQLTRAAAAALALLTSTGAFAQSNNPTGFAITAEIGTTTLEDEDGPGNTFDGRGTGRNLDFEWRFFEYVAIGMNFTDFGDDTDEFNGVDTNLSVDGFGVYLRGYLPVSDRVTLHARYGDTSYNADLDPGGGTFFPFSDSAKDYGVGGDVYLNDHWAVRLQMRWLDGDNKEEGSIATIGLRWQF